MKTSPFEVVQVGGVNVIAVKTDVDVSNSAEFLETAQKVASSGAFVIDLTDCSYMDSSGFYCILEIGKRFGLMFGGIILPKDHGLTRVLAIYRLPSKIEVSASRDEAVDKTQSNAG